MWEYLVNNPAQSWAVQFLWLIFHYSPSVIVNSAFNLYTLYTFVQSDSLSASTIITCSLSVIYLQWEETKQTINKDQFDCNVFIFYKHCDNIANSFGHYNHIVKIWYCGSPNMNCVGATSWRQGCLFHLTETTGLYEEVTLIQLSVLWSDCRNAKHKISMQQKWTAIPVTVWRKINRSSIEF